MTSSLRNAVPVTLATTAWQQKLKAVSSVQMATLQLKQDRAFVLKRQQVCVCVCVFVCVCVYVCVCVCVYTHAVMSADSLGIQQYRICWKCSQTTHSQRYLYHSD